MNEETWAAGNRTHAVVTCMTIAWLLAAPGILTAAEPATPILQARQVQCAAGPVVKTFGKTEWLVRACSDDSLMLSPAPSNPATHPFTFRFNEPGDPFAGDRLRDERAKAAYRDLMARKKEQIDALVRDIRASTQNPQGSK